MGSLQTAWGTVTGALENYQSALNVVANNTANASTPGYTRETSTWEENVPAVINGRVYGRGATLTGAASQRDSVLEQRIQQQGSTSASLSARLTALNNMQSVFSQLTTSSGSADGIGQDVSAFFTSLAQLESNPAENALREQVLSSAGTMTSAFQSAASNLQSQQVGLDQQAASLAGEVNALTDSIAKLNQQIASIRPSGDAGTLEDQRQQDLRQLSQLVGIHVIQTENNGITVQTSSGALLVAKDQSFALKTGNVAGLTHFYDATGADITAQLASGGGQLGGMLTARDNDIPQVQGAIDTLAYSIATSLNTQNTAGSDLNGVPGGAMFGGVSTVAGSAKSINLLLTSPATVAAAGAGLGPADNTNAVAMANLATSSIVSGTTASNYYSNFVSTLGSLVAQVSTENTAQQSSVTQLTSQRNALSQVNLNEEAVALEDYQRSYEAASKIFTILDSIMATALNLGLGSTVS